MKLKSAAFGDQETIPKFYTAFGEEVSPPLRWSDAPAGAKSFALICEDPDVPKEISDKPYSHWVLYNIAPDTKEIPEGLPHREQLEAPISCDQGKNSKGGIGYMGPKPPLGTGTHRYVFTLYALDAPLKVEDGKSRDKLLQEMNGHVLGHARLVGTCNPA